jgi:bacterioferritin-associated ferredoxin
VYACSCRQITEAEVRRVGRSGINRPDNLVHTLGLDDASCCGRCALDIERFVELAREGLLESPVLAGSG